MARELWAKIAVEASTDPKLICRPEADRWLWIGMILLAKEKAPDGVLRGYTPTLLKSLLVLRAPVAKVKAALDYFESAGMVRQGEDGSIALVNFVKRQGEMKDSREKDAERQRKKYWKDKGQCEAHAGTSREDHAQPPAPHATEVEEEVEEEVDREKEKKEKRISDLSSSSPERRAREATPTEQAKVKNALGLDRKPQRGAAEVRDLVGKVVQVIDAAAKKREGSG